MIVDSRPMTTESTADGRELLARVQALGWAAIGHEGEARLACQTRVLGDLEVVTRPEFNWFGLTGRK